MRETLSAILLVEDDPDVSEALVEALRFGGYHVVCAANGLDALELLRRADPLPRVILLDLMMPVMDGWQFRAAQRQDPALANIPVIALTAHGDADGIDAAEYLRKPVDLDQLLHAVSRVCAGDDIGPAQGRAQP